MSKSRHNKGVRVSSIPIPAYRMPNRCNAPRCKMSVPSNLPFCRDHWFMLSMEMRDSVIDAGRVYGYASDEYREAVKGAVAQIKKVIAA